MTALTGAARVAGVMGWPVAHSRSPRLHGFWLAEHGIDGAYVPLPVHPDRLEAALRGLAALGLKGCNLTVPLKERALRLVDRADAIATRIGAVNTVVVDADGTLAGSNTDAFGFAENLRLEAPDWRPDAGAAVVLGAGGAARAVVAALQDLGVPEIRVANRSPDRAEELAADLGDRVRPVPWEERERALGDAALAVNTTTLGMHGQPPLPLDLGRLPPAALVTDIVYAPLETPLLAAARARGNPVVDGLGMLLHQARPGFEAWFGVRPQVTPALRRAMLGDG
jgi:shikimate dehydrogenase